MAQKLLSIVVPTKNRYYYLKYLIQLIDGLHSDEVEMVIQDNSDDNTEFVEYLNANHLDFIHYDYVKGQIPMSDNSDRGILNSTGEYICFLGDDDGLTKYTIDVVKWMKKNGIEAVKPADCTYFWPDAKEGRGVTRSADINYKTFTGRVMYLTPLNELKKVLKDGIPNRGDMPLAYHAMVSREALDRIYQKCGTFFPGNSPDISNAVALSLVVKKYALVDLPLAFSGNCVFRGGGVGAPGKKYPPEINDMPWFRPNAEADWIAEIPKIAVGETIWPESAISALNAMGQSELLRYMNYSRMYARFALNKPTLVYLLKDVCKNKFSYKVSYYGLFAKKYLDAVNRRFKWSLGIDRTLVVRNLNDVIDAQHKFEELTDGCIK